MMRWTLDELAQATGGRIMPFAGTVVPIDGVGIDTRTLKTGQLWVALRGERDGHDYAPAAVEAGAGALLVDRPAGTSRPEIVVADTSLALLDIGRAARARMVEAIVAGITGSVGKTSTKDLLAGAVAGMPAGMPAGAVAAAGAEAVAGAVAGARRTVASPGSFNNELGLPLTLANAPEDAEVVILEMGARGPGHIALLCEIGRPTIGVVTSVAAAHTEMFGDLEGVARAKGELVEALPESGTAVLNFDDHRTRAMAARTRAAVLTYSAAGDRHADLMATHIELDGELRPTFRAETPWGVATVSLEARGAHQVGNALAALAAAAVAGIAIGDAADAMRTAARSPHRMDVRRTTRGATVINDSYNANPVSMRAALQALAALPATRRVAVLGVMAELGPDGPAEHRRIAERAEEMGIEVIAVGTDDYGSAKTAEADDVPQVIGPIDAGTAVLIKASRVAALERVATRLLRPEQLGREVEDDQLPE